MNELLQRIADYFVYQYKGNDEIAPKMDISVDDLRNIAALNVEKCKLETKLRNLQQVKTTADRIRNMTDEELAEFLVGFKNTFGKEYEGEQSCLNWLQSEVE